MSEEEKEALFQLAFDDMYEQLREFFTDSHICDEDCVALCKRFILASDFSLEGL